jgi:hypothetical protein
MTLFDDDLGSLDLTVREPVQPKPPVTILAPDESLVTAALAVIRTMEEEAITARDVWAALGMPEHACSAYHCSRIIDALMQPASGRQHRQDGRSGVRWYRRTAPCGTQEV